MESTRTPEPPPATPPPRAAPWRTLWRAYPRTVAVLVAGLGLLGIANIVLAATHVRYRREIDRLREAMSEAERRRVDLVLASERHQLRVALELVRRQARGDRELHLAVEVDSGRLILERDGVVLRLMSAQVGPARVVGVAADTVRLVAPRGARTVTRVLGPAEAWEVPAWVFAARGLPVPEDREVRGALGSLGIVLSGGTVIYALPESGPLADSAWVMPGAVRAAAADLRAIAPNVVPGMSVYFY